MKKSTILLNSLFWLLYISETSIFCSKDKIVCVLFNVRSSYKILRFNPSWIKLITSNILSYLVKSENVSFNVTDIPFPLLILRILPINSKYLSIIIISILK